MDKWNEGELERIVVRFSILCSKSGSLTHKLWGETNSDTGMQEAGFYKQGHA